MIGNGRQTRRLVILLLFWFQVKDIIHENLNVFLGACIDPPNMCILWKYCVRGSLNVR
jgi:hypothetical protein